jgi:hypothetical protein
MPKYKVIHTATNNRKVLSSGEIEVEASSKLKVLGVLATIIQKKHPTVTNVSIKDWIK